MTGPHLSRNEVIQVLQTAAAYDGRKPSEGAIHAWLDAAERCHWSYLDATEAVKVHYSESTEFLMPAHVTHQIRAKRRDRIERAPAAVPVNPVGQARLLELISGAFRSIGADDTQRMARRAAFSRKCPTCRAAPWTRCARSAAGGKGPTAGMHPARFESSVETGPVEDTANCCTG